MVSIDKSRIAIIVPYSELNVVPWVVNSAQLFAEKGYLVDVITTKTRRFTDMPDYVFENEAIKLHTYRPNALGSLKGIGWLFSIRGLARKTLEVCAGNEYGCLIGVDADGVIAAARAASKIRAPFAYLSLEIEYSQGEFRQFLTNFKEQVSSWPLLLRRFLKNRIVAWFKKPMERRAHRHAAFTISLDAIRAKTLMDDNQVAGSRVIIVPTSPIGLKEEPDRTYFRKKYNLPENQILFLQSGGISDVARAYELAESTRLWPENWTLIIHGFAADEQYLDQLRKLSDGRKFFLSTELVPYSELDDLIASADIGVALYRGIDLNYVNMASGKILQYMKCGLPTIATNFPTLVKMLETDRIGICVKDETEIVAAAKIILTDLDGWSERSSMVFRQNYDFSVQFEQVIIEIETLTSRGILINGSSQGISGMEY